MNKVFLHLFAKFDDFSKWRLPKALWYGKNLTKNETKPSSTCLKPISSADSWYPNMYLISGTRFITTAHTKAYRIRNSKLYTDRKEINQKRREQQDAICDIVFCFCVILLCLLIIVYVLILYRFMKNKYNNGGGHL